MRMSWKGRLKKREIYPKNARELELALQEEWSEIPQTVYHKLIESMPKENRGMHC